VLIETPRRSMIKLLGSIESVRRQIDQAYIARAVRSQIAPALSAAEIAEMTEGAEVKMFAAGETLFRQGDEADGLHLIRRGSVMVSQQIGAREIVLSYIAAGNYIGEMALLSDEPRSATVRAAVFTETIVLPATVFKSVVARNPTLQQQLQQRAMKYVMNSVRREAAPESGNLISFLMKQGLGEATDVLLIDESLCVRCNNCEKACADSHDGTSRLDRQAGPTFANIHVPTSCRHCENPHCMKDCPPDALRRNSHGEVIILDTCIGCGNCVRNCPYGVIQLAPAQERRRPPGLLSWLLTGFTTEPGCEHTGDAEGPKKAVKCDMCRGQSGGPACVSACPTGAAIRVSPEKFLDYTGK
jgi:Fe-S-cluster-containing hydrogenase component 2/CRP-like cAMP-binding protein